MPTCHPKLQAFSCDKVGLNEFTLKCKGAINGLSFQLSPQPDAFKCGLNPKSFTLLYRLIIAEEWDVTIADADTIYFTAPYSNGDTL